MKLQEEHALAARTTQLQALLDLQAQATLPTLAAEVIARQPESGACGRVTIDRGSADGVLADMAVIAPRGHRRPRHRPAGGARGARAAASSTATPRPGR